MDDPKGMPASGIDAEDRWRDGKGRVRALWRGSIVTIVDPRLHQGRLISLVLYTHGHVATRARKYDARRADDNACARIVGRTGGAEHKTEDCPGTMHH
jgi:hypothetical protein